MLRCIIFILIAGLSIDTQAQHNPAALGEEKNIFEKIYNAPIKMIGERQAGSISELHHNKPLLIAFVFTRCIGVCNPFLLNLKENLDLAHPDKNYHVLVVSFDGHDDMEAMHQLAKRFKLENDPGWTFAVTDSIKQLNKSVGFIPVWNDDTNQFDHEALLVGINKEGYITKKLIGIRSQHDLDLIVNSINNVFTPSYRLPTESNLFSCFNYDPVTGKNTLGTGLLFIALPAIITMAIILYLVLIGKKPSKDEIIKS